MSEAIQLTEKQSASPSDRREYTRHQWMHDIVLHTRDGKVYDGMCFEVSAGGLSGMFRTAPLNVGDLVLLSPIFGEQFASQVKRVQKNLYSFEFVAITDEQRGKLLERCKRLPLFKSMLDI